MSRRRILLVTSAIVLALFGMVVIVAYVNSAERRALEGTQLVPVLVATEEIDADTPASEIGTRVQTEEWPERLRQDDAVRNLANLEGQVTTAPIRAGEQIVRRQFDDADTVGPPGGADVEAGNEIVSIALDSQRAVGGRVAAGDRVSVIVSVSEANVQSETDTTETVTVDNTTGAVLSDIPVVSVTGGVTGESGDAADTVMVSLEVDQPEAETIVFAMEYGNVWLTLNGEDVQGPDVDTVEAGDLYPRGGGAR